MKLNQFLFYGPLPHPFMIHWVNVGDAVEEPVLVLPTFLVFVPLHLPPLKTRCVNGFLKVLCFAKKKIFLKIDF
jgi:hypothetical protein